MSLASQIAQLTPERLKLLAREINKQQRGNKITPRPQEGGERALAPLSFGQERLWFLDQLVPGNAAYNWPFAIRCRSALDLALYQKALDELARRHEILRTSYPIVNGAPVQMVAPAGSLRVEVTD